MQFDKKGRSTGILLAAGLAYLTVAGAPAVKADSPAEKTAPAASADAPAAKADATAAKADTPAPTNAPDAPSVAIHSVALMHVILLQDEKETYQAAAADKIEAYITGLKDAADKYLSKQDHFDTKNLILRCSIKPGETPSFNLTTKPGLAGPITSGLDRALSAVTPLVVSAPISMEIIFATADRQTFIGHQARILVRAGKMDEAITLLAPLVTDDCKNAFLLQQLGWAYSAKGDYANAEKILKRALAVDPRDFDTWANLVSTYHSEGKVKEAEAGAAESLKVAPDEEAIDVVNINSALFSGQWAKAEAILRKECKRSNANVAPFQVILACTLRWQDKNDEAKKLLQEAMKHDLDDYYAKLAEKQLALLTGDWKTAEELGRKDINKDPKDYESLYDLGVALKGEGKTEEARKAFEAALQPVTPKSVEAAVHHQIQGLSKASSGSNLVKE